MTEMEELGIDLQGCDGWNTDLLALHTRLMNDAEVSESESAGPNCYYPSEKTQQASTMERVLRCVPSASIWVRCLVSLALEFEAVLGPVLFT